MELIVVTGLSGAGKSRAAAALEDMGIYCVDNMPVQLLPQLADVFSNMQSRYPRVALVTDIRAWSDAGDLLYVLEELRSQGLRIRVLYLYADMQTLVKRYKETRRRHPLESDAVSLEAAIRREMEILEPVRGLAQDAINTSNTTLGELKAKLEAVFSTEVAKQGISVNVISFGFKYGAPMEADLVFDVRFLPNPFYIPGLGRHTGLDQDVRDFVMEHPVTKTFMGKVTDMLDFLIPHYQEEGKHRLVIAIGCTGGAHRSVAMTEAVGKYLKDKQYQVDVNHRDLDVEQALWQAGAEPTP